MVKQLAKGKQRLTDAYWSAVGMASVAMLSVCPVFAATDTIWSRFSTILKDIYGQVVAISTIVRTASTGNCPAAVSPDSMMALVPS